MGGTTFQGTRLSRQSQFFKRLKRCTTSSGIISEAKKILINSKGSAFGAKWF